MAGSDNMWLPNMMQQKMEVFNAKINFSII